MLAGNVPPRTITWSTSPQGSQLGRSATQNVLRNSPNSVRPELRDRTNQRSVWEIFFGPSIISQIVTCTNSRIRDFLSEKTSTQLAHAQGWIHETDDTEIYALLGVLYARGLMGLSHHDVKILFGGETGHHVFSSAFSQNRFKFLHAVLAFDDGAENRRPRYVLDKFAAVREVFEMFNQSCARVLVPEAFLTIDESLYASRVKIAFRQFNPMVGQFSFHCSHLEL